LKNCKWDEAIVVSFQLLIELNEANKSDIEKTDEKENYSMFHCLVRLTEKWKRPLPPTKSQDVEKMEN
jgi:hypothetical protein